MNLCREQTGEGFERSRGREEGNQADDGEGGRYTLGASRDWTCIDLSRAAQSLTARCARGG